MPRKNQKRTLITIGAIWILAAAMLLSATAAFAENQSNGSDLYSQLGLFSDVLNKLKQNYVTDLNDEELIKAAIIGMLGSTDPHTNYFTKAEYDEFTTSTKGSFGGLGIQIDKIGDYITVISPIEGTPAYRMGITAGDRIVKVNDVSVVGYTTDEAIKQMRGDVGTEVLITISRPGVAKPLEFKIIRETIRIKSVPYSFKLDNGVGYIRLSQFSENTVQELRAALSALESEGIKGLIIDLRWNPGGLLDQAVETETLFDADHAAPLRLAASLTIGEYLLPEHIAQWKAAHPASPVRMAIGNTTAVIAAVVALDADVGFIEGPQTHNDLQVHDWLRDELVVVAAAGHRWSRRRPRAEQLSQSPWILRELGSGTRQAADRWLLAHLGAVNVAFELGSTEAVKRLAAAGAGLALLSRHAVADNLAQGSLVELRTGLPPATRQLALVVRRDRRLGRTAEDFIAHCLQAATRGARGRSGV